MSEPTADSASGWLQTFDRDAVDLTQFGDFGCQLRYGTSMGLVAKASQLINDEFSSNPNRDVLRQSRKGRSLLFCVAERLNDTAAKTDVICAARAIMEDHAAIDGTRRVILDYMHTRKSERGLGHGSRMTVFFKELAKSSKADLYVLAVENSCPFWMAQGFVLEQDPQLVKAYSCFTDAHLLKLPTNESGSVDRAFHAEALNRQGTEDDEDDEAMARRLQEEENDAAAVDPNDEDADDEGEEEEEAAAGQEGSGAVGEDGDLSKALAMSMEDQVSAIESRQREQSDVEKALSLSMDDARKQPSAGAVPNTATDNDDDDLAMAIAMSLGQADAKRARHQD
eukprot:TRINITY_DN48802_c0_g1_i1.p1 TRINITY_DN48802_c0_g1~~TRINITY_DN48802_c0_g1_i1.p1  ORF type:complete len:339 (-),score=65.18 TRINITY_DN48802_c0_g1_i1:22-1038(-)